MAISTIYLDNNATTRVDPAVLDAMLPFLGDLYGNPSAAYRFGSQVGKAIERAREQVAVLLGCEPGEVVFTSCGTESDNTAILSALQVDPDRRHVVTTSIEHSAILKQCEALARRGFEITRLKVDERGQIDLGELERAIRPDTAIVSAMWANNETGMLLPIDEIAEVVRAKRVLFHTDAVQAVGKIPMDLAASKINFLSLSGHKLHAPKGIGALYVNRRTRFNPMLLGGGQENGRRAGTENVAGIVALGKAAELAASVLASENREIQAMRDWFENGVLARIPGAHVNGDRARRLPNTANISFDGVDSEGVLMLLDKSGVCCSAGSACTAGSIHPSHVLRAMGLSTDRARASLRFSFSRFNTQAEVEQALTILTGVIEKLRGPGFNRVAEAPQVRTAVELHDSPATESLSGPACPSAPASAEAAQTLLYKRANFVTHLPVEYRYSPSHFWAAQEEGGWRIGFTKFATRMLGEIVDQNFDLPLGSPVSAGQVVGTIEGFKALTEIFCIANGEFAGVNPALTEDIALISRDPYGAGWLYRVRGELDPNCVDVEGYRAILDATIDRILEKQTQQQKQ